MYPTVVSTSAITISILALLTSALPKPQFAGAFPFSTNLSPFNDPNFPFGHLSGDVHAASRAITKHKLGVFCHSLLDTSDDGHVDPSNFNLNSSSNANYNSNSNYNSGGRNYSSSYSNNNGHVTSCTSDMGCVSNEGNRNGSHDVKGNNTNNYILDGVQVPEALQSFRPATIEKACVSIVETSGKGDEKK